MAAKSRNKGAQAERELAQAYAAGLVNISRQTVRRKRGSWRTA